MTDRTVSPVEWSRDDGLCLLTDPQMIDAQIVCDYLASNAQSPGIPLDVVKRMIEGSVNFGLFEKHPNAGGDMIGYGRVVTDYAAFAYIGDVFLLEDWRGGGRGRWMMDRVFEHPGLQNLRRWTLSCGPGAFEWWKTFGFEEPGRPGYMMHITDKEIYLRASEKP